LVKGPAWLAKLGTLSLLYAAVFVTRIGFGAIIWIFPLYIQAGPAVTGIVTALYPAVEGFSALPVGAYVDQRGRRRAFIAGLILISSLTLVIGLSNNIFLVGGAHAIEGLAAALITVSSLAMITDLTVEKNRGTGMGAFNLFTLAGYGVGLVLGVAFSQVFSASLGDSFLIVAGIMAVAPVFAYFALKEPVHAAQERRSLRQIYDSLTGDVSSILPVWFALTIVLGFYLFIPRLLKEARPGIAQSYISQVTPLILLGLVVLGAGAVLFGRVSDKVGRTRTMVIGLAGQIGFLLVFPDLFQKLILVPQGTPFLDAYNMIGPILFLAAVLFFFGAALLPSVLAYMADKASLGFRGATMGLYSLMLSIGLALGTVLAGFADELGSQSCGPPCGVQGVFYSAVVILALLSVVSGFLLRKTVSRNRVSAMGPA
jgi:MFS transporter, DHA1 family, multidrug resistance protein